MLVQPLSALALALTLTNGASTDDVQPRRSIEPTENELAQFRLTNDVNDLGDSPSTPLFRASGIGMFAASAADLVSTEYGLSQGLAEGNPAASERSLRIATHVVGPMAVYYASERLDRAGRTKTALLLRVSLMVAYSYAAIHNARLIHSSP